MADFCPQFVPNDAYKQKSESNLLIALTFLVPRVKTKLNFRVPQGLLFLPYRWRCI